MLFYYYSLQINNFPSEQFCRLDGYDLIADYKIAKQPSKHYKKTYRLFQKKSIRLFSMLLIQQLNLKE